MNNTTTKFVKMINEKYDEVRAEYTSMKTNDGVSKATRNNRLYHFNRDCKSLKLIAELLSKLPDDVTLSDDSITTLNTLSALKSERVVYSVNVEVGDKLLDIMQKYSDVKDLLNKVNKAAERVNAKVDFTTGEIVAL